MTTSTKSNKPYNYKRNGYYFTPNENGICVCALCEPTSWAKMLKVFEYEIAQEKVYRAMHPEILNGGIFPPSARKRRFEQAREMHKLGISEGF